jgi:hypothetical protein
MRFPHCLMAGLILLLGACTTAPPVEPTMVTVTQVCEEPRPQVCTMDYRPVCASLTDGGIKTYANGCTACGDAAVSSWTEGACEQQ